jgi:hypothetical protein
MKWRYAFRVLAVLLLAVGLTYGAARSSAQHAQAVSSVTLSAPLDKPEAWDYATRTWGDPWDMDEQSDVYLVYTSCPSPSGAGFTGVTTSGGIWSGTVGTSPSYMILLNPGYQSTLDTLQDGQVRPLNADTYRWITFRMYSSAGTTAAFYWMKGDLSEFSKYGVSQVFAISSGWNIYAMYMPSLVGGGAFPELWNGSITGLRFDVFGSGRQIKLDWMRISEGQTGNTVSWSGTGLGGNVEIAFDNGDGNGYARLRYFPSGNSAQPISTDSGGGSFDVPASFAPGTYSAQVTVSGGSAASVNQWTFHAAPIAQIVAPSYTSGEDFATTVVGNPWDMEGVDDVNASWTENESYAASGGILDITNHDDGRAPCTAPWPHRPLALNLGGHTVDTNKYKYLAYRYKVDQAPDQGDGGVIRVRWLDNVKWWAGRTDDISLYDNGWHTYKLDLSSVDLEVEMAGWVGNSWPIFQLMANEAHDAWTSHLDWVKLTAENQTSGAYMAGWNIVQGTVLTTTAYWDANQTPGGLIGGYVVPTQTTTTPPPGPEFVYLPLVMRSYGAGASELEAEKTYSMSSAGLSNGQYYYFVLKLEDGYNTVYWYSELPVKKNP